MQLKWHTYRYYPYERALAIREVESLLQPEIAKELQGGLQVERPTSPECAKRLVYFAEATGANGEPSSTVQRLLERVNGNGHKRQSTRYSAHGLHEYKGKFNPQVAKAILNILGISPGQLALDPFCGSGTSLVECAHLRIRSVGTDINPLAIFLANAKLRSLGISAQKIIATVAEVCDGLKRSSEHGSDDNLRDEYLKSWFSAEVFDEIEGLRQAIEACVEPHIRNILLAIASNLLRDYSLQEPSDLRIRRRKSPMPSETFLNAFRSSAETFCTKLADAQGVLGIEDPDGQAFLLDCRKLGAEPGLAGKKFDAAITSPPYATALPYIDTQRLSLVWLGLTKPSAILELESDLVGSREIRKQKKSALTLALKKNSASLPDAQHDYCILLQNALSQQDGFRRQNVPRLLYRYFADMAEAFVSLRSVLKPNAPFALIVGGNHTVLGGQRFDIDTPTHLANIAAAKGWRHVETVPLQTYQRFGLHMSNATHTEALIVLRN